MSLNPEALAERPAAVEEIPPAPLTVEGWSVLHQMFRIRRPAWRALADGERTAVVAEAAAVLDSMERNQEGQSALFSMLGHKGDLMVLHFRNSFDELMRSELKLAQLRLSDFLEPATSYLSVIELGLYDSSIKLFRSLAERGLEAHSPEWNAEVAQLLARQKEAMHPRLYPQMPSQRYLCFYPMDRKRGEDKNFYTVPMTDRGRMMRDHGMVGRRFSDQVQQIITGSIGFDDWEWGVDLFAEDPLVFKKLIYEMRFDEVSAVYALFGAFYIGIRVPAAQLGLLMRGDLPRQSEVL